MTIEGTNTVCPITILARAMKLYLQCSSTMIVSLWAFVMTAHMAHTPPGFTCWIVSSRDEYRAKEQDGFLKRSVNRRVKSSMFGLAQRQLLGIDLGLDLDDVPERNSSSEVFGAVWVTAFGRFGPLLAMRPEDRAQCEYWSHTGARKDDLLLCRIDDAWSFPTDFGKT